MEKHLFTVFDSAAGMYLDPFVAPSVDFALREFRKVANTEGHQFNNFPSDYTLYHIGTFVPETGALYGTDPRSLGVAVQFVEQIQIPLNEDSTNA